MSKTRIKRVLEIKNLYKSFKRKTVLKRINLTVFRGEIFGLVGPNGAGKTVLVSTILGLISEDKGEIKIFGKKLNESREIILSQINAASTYDRLYKEATVWQNLLTFAKLYNISNKKKKIKEVVNFFGLKRLTKEKRLVKYFSTGEHVRLLLAKAFINNPRLIFLDEPDAVVDQETRQKLKKRLAFLNKKEGLTIFYISHHWQEVENFCHRVALIKNGRIMAIGRPRQLRKH